MSQTVEQRLLEEYRHGTARLKREIGYNPIYFNWMLSELGPIEASRRLVRATAASDGFTTLWEHKKLDMSVEAIVLLPWYAEILEDEDRRQARTRLEAYGFDVDQFLTMRTAAPPAWASKAGPDDQASF